MFPWEIVPVGSDELDMYVNRRAPRKSPSEFCESNVNVDSCGYLWSSDWLV